MALRSFRDRMLQTLCYEAGGLVVVTPLYAAVMGRAGAESLGLMVALSAAILTWTPLFNTVFDLVDFRRTGRVASDRPRGLRLVHAVAFEVSTFAVSLPVLVWLGGHRFVEAIAVDLGLTVAYSVYAYGFFLLYDHWRPVRRRPRAGNPH
jgi:uncharacterized membrane protein